MTYHMHSDNVKESLRCFYEPHVIKRFSSELDCCDLRQCLSNIVKYVCTCFYCRSIDTSDAIAVPGVVAFISAKDIPGSNVTGPVFYDETVFADEKVD